MVCCNMVLMSKMLFMVLFMEGLMICCAFVNVKSVLTAGMSRVISVFIVVFLIVLFVFGENKVVLWLFDLKYIFMLNFFVWWCRCFIFVGTYVGVASSSRVKNFVDVLLVYVVCMMFMVMLFKYGVVFLMCVFI